MDIEGVPAVGSAAAADALVQYLRRALRFFATRTKGDGRDPTTVLKFKSAGGRIVYFLVAHAQQTNSALFEAELFAMEPALASDGGEATLPMVLGLCPGPMVCGTQWPDIRDEHEAAMALVREDLVWEISVMTSRPALLGQRYITDETIISAIDVAEKERAKLQQARAMRAFKKITQVAPAIAKPSRRKPRTSAARSPASGQGAAAAASSSDRPPAASGTPGVDAQSSDSSDSAESVSDEDVEDCWHAVLKSLIPKTKAKLDRVGGKARLARPLVEPLVEPLTEPLAEPLAEPLVGDDAPIEVPEIPEVPDLPAAAPPLARGPRAEPARRGARIVEMCGGFAPISEVMGSARDIIGYGIVCGRHNNVADKLGTQCKKQCLLGKGPSAISQLEARLRLKRWFVAGQFQEESWPIATMRTKHLKVADFEGRQLALYASDTANALSSLSADDLDAACRLVPPPPIA